MLTQKAREYQAVSQMALQAKGNPNAEGTVLGGMARSIQAQGASIMDRTKSLATGIKTSMGNAWRQVQVTVARGTGFGVQLEKESQKGVGAIKRFENGVARAGSGIKAGFEKIGSLAEVTSLAATVALTQIMTSQSEAEAKASEMATSIGAGIDTSKFAGAVQRYNLLVGQANDAQTKFQQAAGDDKSILRLGFLS